MENYQLLKFCLRPSKKKTFFGVGLVLVALISFFINDFGSENMPMLRWLYSVSFFCIGVSVIIESRGYRLMTKIYVAFNATDFEIKTDYVKHIIEWSLVEQLVFSEKQLKLVIKNGSDHHVPIGHLSDTCIASLKKDFLEQAIVHGVDSNVD